MDTKSILTEALQLRPAERLQLIEWLIQSLNKPDEKIEQIWAVESEKRYSAVLLEVISLIEDSKFIYEIPHNKKIQGFNSLYRIKIGDYRLAMEEITGQEVNIIRFLHRKEIPSK